MCSLTSWGDMSGLHKQNVQHFVPLSYVCLSSVNSVKFRRWLSQSLEKIEQAILSGTWFHTLYAPFIHFWLLFYSEISEPGQVCVCHSLLISVQLHLRFIVALAFSCGTEQCFLGSSEDSKWDTVWFNCAFENILSLSVLFMVTSFSKTASLEKGV